VDLGPDVGGDRPDVELGCNNHVTMVPQPTGVHNLPGATGRSRLS
jgi:hypothetical protein